MTLLGALLGVPGDTRLVTGIEEDPEFPGGLRVYLGMRSQGIHSHLFDPEAAEEMRQQWPGVAQHLFVDVPDSALCRCTLEKEPVE